MSQHFVNDITTRHADVTFIVHYKIIYYQSIVGCHVSRVNRNIFCIFLPREGSVVNIFPMLMIIYHALYLNIVPYKYVFFDPQMWPRMLKNWTRDNLSLWIDGDDGIN